MKRTSIQQLKKDFTVFPFPGLGKNALVDFEFEIYDTKLKKAKAILTQAPDIIENYKKIISTGKEYNELFTQLEDSFSSLKKSLKELKLAVTSPYNENKFLGVIIGSLLILILILISPFLTLGVLATFSYLGSITFLSFVKKNFNLKDTLGHVSVVSGNRIFINNKNTDREERTISHEHCHLMQFNNSKLVNLIYDTNLNLEKLVLNNSPTDHERYLFSKIELEVRVHEFIRTVYYKNGKIPTELNEFYNEVAEFMKKDLTSENLGSDLISLSHTISLSAYDFLLLNNETTSNKEMLKLWKEKEREMFDKFICDILFVCYIKLIQYYGYLDLSKKLGNTVNFPNLYNQIYETNL
ncbi:hypothetical protein [Aliivibrio fischeri]|uniref:hypothetical protein n=1 Tax=Aliivibrio fischeri TaxID=668 RepID=UPI00090827F2|nr:hypothetical protein [Aliivibrio fischeri]